MTMKAWAVMLTPTRIEANQNRFSDGHNNVEQEELVAELELKVDLNGALLLQGQTVQLFERVTENVETMRIVTMSNSKKKLTTFSDFAL